jgi:hypothetical protein
VLEYGETHWILAVKEKGGLWGWNDAAIETTLVMPTQSFRELADLTYAGAMFVNMDHMVIQRFRKAPTAPVPAPSAPAA